jgi:hypothetical protein
MDAIDPQQNRLLQLERKQVRLDDDLSNLTRRLTTLEQRIWQSWGGLGFPRYGSTPTPTPTPTTCSAPTLNTLSNLTYCGDPGAVTVSLSGITDGMGGTALPIVITATSSSTFNIPNPTVTYTSPNITGSIQFTPRAGLNNCATPVTISVKAKNNCNTGTLGGTNSIVRTFTVVVTQPVTPSLNAIGNVGPIAAGSANQTVNLSGIGPGTCNASGSLTVTASSSNPAVSGVVSVSYTNPHTTGSVVISIGVAGTATITVTVTDGNPGHCGGTTKSQSFNVTVV